MKMKMEKESRRKRDRNEMGRTWQGVSTMIRVSHSISFGDLFLKIAKDSGGKADRGGVEVRSDVVD